MMAQLMAIVRKDLLLEWRGKANLNALTVLALMIVLTMSFALGSDPTRLRLTAPAVVWVAIVFAAVLAFVRAYQMESENRCFEGMLLAGADPRAIYLAKLAVAALTMLVLEVVVIPTILLLDGIALGPRIWGLLPIAVLGTAGLSAVGSLYGRLTMAVRAREVMLPLLVLPVVVPIVLAAARASDLLFHGPAGQLGTWVGLLVVADVVLVTAGLLTYESIAED